MTEGVNAKQVAIIGSGRFIQHTVLPAFLSLKKQYCIKQIFNRSGKLNSNISNQTTASVQTDISKLNPNIDVIFISVPLSQVKTVLNKLIQHKIANKTVLLTTPVAPISCLFKLKRLAQNNRLYAFEFLPFHPAYQQIKAIIDNGILGRVKKISLVRSGYLYHGLATLRFLTNRTSIEKAKRLSSTNNQSFSFSLTDSTLTEMIGPKDYEQGYIFIEGTEKVLSSNSNTKPSKNTINFKHLTDQNQILSGYQLNDGDVSILKLEEIEDELLCKHLENLPIYQQEFLIAAYSYIKRLHSDNHQALYKPEETLFEHYLIRITRLVKQYKAVTLGGKKELLLKFFQWTTN